jgi:hypothetical protein
MADDITTGNVQTLGLKQTTANFATIAGPLKDKIGRAAALQGALVMNRAIKAATYTTFHRATGFIQSGFGVRVGKHLTPAGVLNTFVVEYPQKIIGSSDIATAYRRQYISARTSKRSVSIAPQVAFWWRFLEFGTHPRFAKKAPSFLKRGQGPHDKRHSDWHSLRAYAAAGSRGQIFSRAWIRPSTAASEHQAVATFSDTFRQQTEIEIDRLPK